MLAAICFCGIAFAQEQNGAAPYLSLPLNGAGIQNVLASTEGGYITVTSADPKNAQVEVYLKCAKGQMSSNEMERDLNENYKFDLGMHGDTLSAQLIRKSADVPAAKRLYASFLILVPANVNTKLITAGGDITLDGLAGKQDFVTSGGKLVVLRLSGDIKGATSGGDIVVNGCKQNIDLSTSGGKIIASNCDGTIKLSTSGGKIILADLRGDINATTGNNDVVGKNLTGNLKVCNVAGNIALAGLSCTVTAATTNGNLYADVTGLRYTARLIVNGGDLKIIMPKQLNADLELNADKVTGYDLQNFSGVKQNGKVSGQLNGGGAKLIASDTGGAMDIKTM